MVAGQPRGGRHGLQGRFQLRQHDAGAADQRLLLLRQGRERAVGAGNDDDGVLAGATGGGDMTGPGAVLNLYLREVGCLRQGGPRRTVSCADASGIVNIA